MVRALFKGTATPLSAFLFLRPDPTHLHPLCTGNKASVTPRKMPNTMLQYDVKRIMEVLGLRNVQRRLKADPLSVLGTEVNLTQQDGHSIVLAADRWTCLASRLSLRRQLSPLV